MRPMLPMTILVAAFASSACDRSETSAAATTASAPAPKATTTAATAGATTGVGECDEYLARYEACLAAKVPAEAQAMLKQSLASTREAWAQTLAAGGKDALKSSCEMARNASRASMQAYGCTDF